MKKKTKREIKALGPIIVMGIITLIIMILSFLLSLIGVESEEAVINYSNLEMSAPDLATEIFGYDDKVVEMHLDYFGRVNNRRTELFCRDDVLVVDFNNRTITRQLAGTVNEYGADDQFYINEMEYFIKMIHSEGKIKNINTIDNAFANLKLAKGYSVAEVD